MNASALRHRAITSSVRAEKIRTTTPAEATSISLSPGGTIATVRPCTVARSPPAVMTADASSAGKRTTYSSG